MSEIWWVLEAIGDSKFPYRLSIKKGDETLLYLKAQDRWPVGKANIFCLRDEASIDRSPVKEIERVPVISLRRYGKRLSVVLDRPKYKGKGQGLIDFCFFCSPPPRPTPLLNVLR